MIKRLFDLITTFIIILALSPILLLLICIIRIKLGSPVFFKQKRPGLHGSAFEMIKFRTMTDAKDSDGNLLPDTERITALGSFLRSTSLDELPELWNVVRGDMSLVGPRPLLMEYMDYYYEDELLRHSIKPGITGLAQINGRNNLNWHDRIKLDVKYAKECSLILDIKIILKTIIKVILREDVIVAPHGTRKKLSEVREKQR